MLLWCSGWCLGLLCRLLRCSGWLVGWCLGFLCGSLKCSGWCLGYYGVEVGVWNSYVGYCGVVVGVWDSLYRLLRCSG